MHVLFVGGTRFIGRHAAVRLVQMGHKVTVFHRGKSEGELPPEVGHIHGDRAQLLQFAPEFGRARPDVVIDMTLMSADDARSTAEVFGPIARRIVAISSIDVYRAYGRIIGTEPGPPDPVPLTESSPLREKHYPFRSESDPNSTYDKILVEQSVMAGTEYEGVVLRLPMVYGPGDRRRLHEHFGYWKRMVDRRPAIFLPEKFARMRGARAYVGNVADAIVLCAMDAPAAGRVYHVADEECLSEAEWVEAIGRAFGWEGSVIALPYESLPGHLRSEEVEPEPEFNQHWSIDSSRIRTELGFRDRFNTDEALRRTVEWERTQPALEVEPKMFDYEAEDKVLSQLATG